MQPEEQPQRELTTWSEIARYLGVTERTAQLWRKERNLPVRKIGGRVAASIEDLENWKKAPRQPQPSPRGISSRWLAVAAVAVIALAIWIAGASKPRLRLAKFERHGNTLVVFDESGKRAWTREYPEPLEDPKYSYPEGRLSDIDGDGRRELLFVPWQADCGKLLQCYRTDGSLAWEHETGRTVTDVGGREIPNDFQTSDIAVLKKPRPDGGRVVLLGHHRVSWPARVAVLTAEGRVVAEYWHPGWLLDMDLTDLDGDGVEEILVSGVNNSFAARGDGAVLVVLDSGFKTAQGPIVPGDPRWVRGIPSGEQRAVLVFPNLPDHNPHFEVNVATSTQWHGDFLEVRCGDKSDYRFAHYRLDRRLRVIDIDPSAMFLEKLSPGSSAGGNRDLVWRLFGNVKTLKNDFDSEAANERSSAGSDHR